MTNEPPKFPVLIHMQRVQASPTWEACDPDQITARLTQLRDDPTVNWFYAYDVESYRVRQVKKTIVVTDEPTGDAARGTVKRS